MIGSRAVSPLTLLTMFGLAAAPAPLSDPIGVFALVDRVVLEPNAENPTAIQIWGVFALAVPTDRNAYNPAQRGYLYYSLNSTNPRATRAEWSDMRAAAGTGQALGFGSRFEPMGRVRRASEAPASPDNYPLGFGLVKVTTGAPGARATIQQELKLVPSPLAPADGGAVPAGEVRLVTRNIADRAAQYVFTIEGGSQSETSKPIPAGNGETAWSPTLRLEAGREYTWHVLVVKDGQKGTPATASFRTSK
jgi:hypothetical protein